MKEGRQKERVAGKYLAWMCLLLGLLLIPQAHAILSLSGVSQVSPVEYGNVQTISANIVSNVSISHALIEINGQNYSMQQNAPVYSYSWLPSSMGTNSYKLYFANADAEAFQYSNSFTVADTSAPQLVSSGPSGYINTNPAALSIVTNENATCKYDTSNVSYASMRYNFTGNSTIHTESRSLIDGQYEYYVRCRDGSLNEGANARITFITDTSAPQITTYSPIGTQTQSQHGLRLTTNEAATCKWDTLANEYDSMQNTFQNTGSTVHEHQITLNEGVNQFFAACKDLAQNRNSKITFTVELNKAPSVKIFVEKAQEFEALKPGTYPITVTASESLQQAPAIALNCNGRIVNVPLQGATIAWRGYLIVPEESMDCSGEFTFTGYDLKNTVGYEVTEGKLILVDTIKPAAPTGVFAENQDGKVKIGWTHSGFEIERYDVYRSTTGNTDKNSLMYSSVMTSYLDSGVQNKIGYFYRVVAVSHSGLESDLSSEAFVMSDNPNITVFKQDPAVLAVIEGKIAELERVYSKIEVQEKRFDVLVPEELIVLQANDVETKLAEAKNGVQSMLGELRALRETPVTSKEVTSRMLVMDARLDVLKSKIFMEVSIMKKTSIEQVYNETLLLAVVDEYLKAMQIAPDQKERYLGEAVGLQDSSRLTQEIIEYEIFYENANSESGVVIVEDILMPDGLRSSVVAQEILPRGRIKLSDIDFQVEPGDINSFGPMWRVDTLSEGRIVYNKQGLDESTEFTIKTVLFPDLEAFLAGASQNSSSQITGNAVAADGDGSIWMLFATLGMGLVLAGLLVYYIAAVLRVPSGQNPKGESNINPEDDYGIIKDLLSQSRLALEKGELHHATDLYNRAKDVFHKSRLGPMKKLKVNLELNTLYEDILVKSI